jgi:hypothetical protein
MPALAALLVLLAADAPAPAPAHCAVGARSTLDVEVLDRPATPRHDENIGRDRLVLRDADGKARFKDETSDGHFVCLGYDRAKARYLVGVYQEAGVWLVLSSIQYLPEDAANGPHFEPSVFAKKEYVALASVTSASGRYLAFVGGVGVADALYVLDTESDTIRRIGRAPAPPPVSDGFECDEPFRWGTCWADAYKPFEPAIVHFDGDAVLVISRGHDTPKRRATRRAEQRVKL